MRATVTYTPPAYALIDDAVRQTVPTVRDYVPQAALLLDGVLSQVQAGQADAEFAIVTQHRDEIAARLATAIQAFYEDASLDPKRSHDFTWRYPVLHSARFVGVIYRLAFIRITSSNVVHAMRLTVTLY